MSAPELLYRSGIDNCPECLCWYHSPRIQGHCRDGACDCHHEPLPEWSDQ